MGNEIALIAPLKKSVVRRKRATGDDSRSNFAWMLSVRGQSVPSCIRALAAKKGKTIPAVVFAKLQVRITDALVQKTFGDR